MHTTMAFFQARISARTPAVIPLQGWSLARMDMRHASTFRHRISKTLVPTSKQKFVHVSGQEMVPSQQLLLRAGMMRQSSSGIYSILPYGQRALDKIERIIDEELESIGCQKLSMPNMLSADLWKKTGRWETTGPEMFKLQDRKGADYLLAPTHEEEVTNLIAKEVSSYRQLPLRVYQVGRKFRDELRARSGLLRGKEFLMKDLYTFDVSEEEAYKTYNEVVEAYRQIMKRLGIPYAVAEADTGNIGGTHSHEFHILSQVGEDSLLSCRTCGYTSNEERAVGVLPDSSNKTATKFRNTENASKWIESLDLIPRSAVRVNPKTQFGVLTTPSEDDTKKLTHTLIAVATTADRDVNEVKLSKAFGNVEFASSLDELKTLLGDTKVDKLMLCIDESLYPSQQATRPKEVAISGPLPDELSAITRPEGSGSLTVHYGDYHNCKPGDGCPLCIKNDNGFVPMTMTRAIEIGHTFMLGTKYSAPLEAKFQTANGTEEEPFQMGCYGIGISRLLASIVEASHDHKGIIWPDSVAPFKAVIVTSEDEGCISAAENAYETIQKALESRSDVVIDDRAETTLGFKMKDAELIGYPWMIIIGKGYLRTGLVEVQHRKTGKKWSLEWAQIEPFFREQKLGLVE